MKKAIKLSERDLHNIVNESVEQILSEGNFWGNMGGAVQGAMNGWRANRNTTRQNQPNITSNQNANQKAAELINELYRTVGGLATEWGQKGTNSTQYGSYMNAIRKYVRMLDNYFSWAE